jgi:1-acyl-sn-glycerol-3-phosphate acyltransferase
MAPQPHSHPLLHSHDRSDAAFIKSIRPVMGVFYDRYFRVGYHEVQNLPQGPALLVGNHNGIMGCEIFMILEGWLRHASASAGSGERPKVLALAHDVVFENPVFKDWVPKLGAIPAREELAREAFEKGYSVLVYPGGDRDAFRPYSRRAEVDFDGRTGYAKLALEMGVPIVPVTNVGGHEQSIVLWRSDRIARQSGICRRYRIRGLPITLRGLPLLPGLFLKPIEHPALIAYMATSVFPLPAKMDFYFGDPISPLGHDIASLDLAVRKTIQDRLTREYSKPRFPIFGPVGNSP